jgi:hypothetical protein
MTGTEGRAAQKRVIAGREAGFGMSCGYACCHDVVSSLCPLRRREGRREGETCGVDHCPRTSFFHYEYGPGELANTHYCPTRARLDSPRLDLTWFDMACVTR